jgi:tetratricopeptide (TPR) repeat protein
MAKCPKDAALWYEMGQCYNRRKDFNQSIQCFNKALELAPNDMILMRVALSLLNRANRSQDVIMKADALVAKDDTLWWAYEQRAIAKRNMGHKDEAVKDFEASLTAAAKLKDDDAAQEIIKQMADAIGPDEAINRIAGKAEKDDRWRLTLAQLQQLNGQNDAAIKNLEQVLAREDGLVPLDRERAYRFGGTIYLIANQPIKSKQCYDKLLAISPDDMTALNNMACLMGEVMQPPQPQEGLKYSTRAYNLMQQGNRRDPLVLDTHGWLLTLSGQIDEGIVVLRRANELKQIPDAHYHLGEAYLRKQLPEAAIPELETAMAILTRWIQEHQPVDPTLKTKIEAAQSRAAIMAGQRGRSANANTPNAP